MENPQYEQLQLFYTPEEVDAKVSEATTQALIVGARDVNLLSYKLRDKAIEWFKSEVRGGSMVKDDALGIFNGLADALGWDLLDTISSTYSVTVYVDGEEVGTFDEIEADDENSACDEVTENVDVEATMFIRLNYNGSHREDEREMSVYDLDITAEAVEE